MLVRTRRRDGGATSVVLNPLLRLGVGTDDWLVIFRALSRVVQSEDDAHSARLFLDTAKQA